MPILLSVNFSDSHRNDLFKKFFTVKLVSLLGFFEKRLPLSSECSEFLIDSSKNKIFFELRINKKNFRCRRYMHANSFINNLIYL